MRICLRDGKYEEKKVVEMVEKPGKTRPSSHEEEGTSRNNEEKKPSEDENDDKLKDDKKNPDEGLENGNQ